MSCSAYQLATERRFALQFSLLFDSLLTNASPPWRVYSRSPQYISSATVYPSFSQFSPAIVFTPVQSPLGLPPVDSTPAASYFGSVGHLMPTRSS
ncbi:hypothetical protein L596_000687 [Steinernema carpocapsae]|uniref:Uncharacterized protein n=1 Tax=Steinernema carpocapsae TaxID=34508 RepID=A0A4V6I765_STECR|nr:hypothetical protein L596_000687 [Steinernema carpocapsae]